MPKISEAYTKLNYVPSEQIQKTLDGKWYHVTPRTFIVKADNKFYAITLTCFERLKAAFLKIFGGNYFATILKAKEVTVLDRATLMSKENVEAREKRKPVEAAFKEFLAKKAEAQTKQKKMCLLIGCGPTPVPQKGNENWVWLTLSDDKTTHPKFVKMLYSYDDPLMKQLQGTFDKVIGDCHGNLGWQNMHALLKKKPEAEIYVLPPGEYYLEFYNSEDDLLKKPIDYDANARSATITYPWIAPWNHPKNKVLKKEAVEETLTAAETYLKTMFTHATFERQKEFPGKTGKVDHFVLKGPKTL